MGKRKRSRRSSNLVFMVDDAASPTKSILQSLLSLYGLMVLMLGVVIPISDGLAKPVEHADYRHMFYIFMHGTGIICLLYLNTMIACYQQRDRQAEMRTRLQQRDSNIANSANSTPDSPKLGIGEDFNNGNLIQMAPLAQHEDATTDDDETDEKSVEAAAIPGGSDSLGGGGGSGDPSMTATLCARNRQNSSGGGDGEIQIELATSIAYEDSGPQMAERMSPISVAAAAAAAGGTYSRPRRPQRLSIRKSLISRVHKKLSTTWRSPTTSIRGSPHLKGITWSAVGVNLYLRLGAIVFGFGVMVHDGFKIAEVLEDPESKACAGFWFLPKHCIHLVFIMCQTYYVFKHHRVVINAQEAFVRFAFVHLIVTNLCIWMKTVIYEISVGLAHLTDHQKPAKMPYNTTGSSYAAAQKLKNFTLVLNGTKDKCLENYMEDDNPSYKLGPYLYPFAVEYGLICAALCYKFFSRVGDWEVVPYGKKEHPLGPRSTTCHKSHKGLFLGLIIMIFVLVPMISLIFLQKADSKTRYRNLYILAVILIECSVLLCTTAMSVIGLAKALLYLKPFKVRGNEAFDVNLLFVGLAGILCYNLFVAVSVGTCLVDTREGDNCKWGGLSQVYTTKANGLKSLLEVTQSLAQTLFIMQAIQRKVTLELVENQHKPGRGVTIALLISNLAMWIASVFEAQRNVSEQFLLNYFGQMPWYIVKFIFLPLIIFFRFHSTVCLSEIWIQSYKVPKKHHHHPHHPHSVAH